MEAFLIAAVLFLLLVTITILEERRDKAKGTTFEYIPRRPLQARRRN